MGDICLVRVCVRVCVCTRECVCVCVCVCVWKGGQLISTSAMNTLQHTATHCSSLQPTAAHNNTHYECCIDLC